MMQPDPMCCSQTNTFKKKKEKKTVVTTGEGEGGRGKIGAGIKEVQTAMYKIIYKYILYSTGNIANIL